jgi:putative addiction module component (TIGR02574 family)
MAPTVVELERQIRALSTADKAEILRMLIAELDQQVDEDVERAWLEEAQRRYNELQSGTVKAIPAVEVFERARSRLKK